MTRHHASPRHASSREWQRNSRYGNGPMRAYANGKAHHVPNCPVRHHLSRAACRCAYRVQRVRCVRRAIRPRRPAWFTTNQWGCGVGWGGCGVGVRGGGGVWGWVVNPPAQSTAGVQWAKVL